MPFNNRSTERKFPTQPKKAQEEERDTVFLSALNVYITKRNNKSLLELLELDKEVLSAMQKKIQQSKIDPAITLSPIQEQILIKIVNIPSKTLEGRPKVKRKIDYFVQYHQKQMTVIEQTRDDKLFLNVFKHHIQDINSSTNEDLMQHHTDTLLMYLNDKVEVLQRITDTLGQDTKLSEAQNEIFNSVIELLENQPDFLDRDTLVNTDKLKAAMNNLSEYNSSELKNTSSNPAFNTRSRVQGRGR